MFPVTCFSTLLCLTYYFLSFQSLRYRFKFLLPLVNSDLKIVFSKKTFVQWCFGKWRHSYNAKIDFSDLMYYINVQECFTGSVPKVHCLSAAKKTFCCNAYQRMGWKEAFLIIKLWRNCRRSLSTHAFVFFGSTLFVVCFSLVSVVPWAGPRLDPRVETLY